MNDNRRMTTRSLAFLMWGLAAVCAMFWGLRLFVTGPMAPPYAAPVNTQQSVNGDLGKLLGREAVVSRSAAPPPEASSRFKLMGVVAPKNAAVSSEEGLAVIGGEARNAAEAGGNAR